MNDHKTPCLLSPQQHSVFNQLLPIARIATSGCRRGLPVRPRTHSLVIGPSGSGKSHLARALGKHLKLPTLVINVSSWSVLCSKSEPWTFSSICQWLDTSRAGGILVLDEIDKLGASSFDGRPSGSDWMEHIRLEIHDLLDGVIPATSRMPDSADESEMSDVMREMLSVRLRERIFIIGCGAWQHAWRTNTRQMGFVPAGTEPGPPDCGQILSSISAELRQRFRHQVAWLSPMTHADYLSVSEAIAGQIQDPEMKKIWRRLVPAMISDAAEAGLGMRVFEEAMLATLLESPAPEMQPPDSTCWLI